MILLIGNVAVAMDKVVMIENVKTLDGQDDGVIFWFIGGYHKKLPADWEKVLKGFQEGPSIKFTYDK